jgi:undecaprenyl-diphosphatase
VAFPLATDIPAERTRTHSIRRLLIELTAGYAAAWLVGIGFGYALSLTPMWRNGAAWERAMLEWFHAHQLPPWLDQVMLATPYMGTNLTILPLILAIGLLAWRKYGQRLVALQLVIVCLGSLSLNPTMKYLLDRPRPTMFPLRGMYTWAAYPSGHLILTTALYFTISGLLYNARGWRWPFVVTPLIMFMTAYGRLYLAVHWPTDLLGGLLIGITWLFGSWRAFDHYRRRAAEKDATAKITSEVPA